MKNSSKYISIFGIFIVVLSYVCLQELVEYETRYPGLDKKISYERGSIRTDSHLITISKKEIDIVIGQNRMKGSENKIVQMTFVLSGKFYNLYREDNDRVNCSLNEIEEVRSHCRTLESRYSEILEEYLPKYRESSKKKVYIALSS